MKVSVLIYSLLLTTVMLTDISLASTDESEKLLTYSNFGINFDFDGEGGFSIFKKTTTFSTHDMKDNYEAIVGDDLSFKTIESKLVIFADNFEYKNTISKSYLNGTQIGATQSTFTGIEAKDSITISYLSLNNQAKNNKKLSFQFPVHDIDISNKAIVSEPSSIGIAAINMAMISIILKQNHLDLGKKTPLPNLVFPEGSRCLVFGKVNTNLPSYDIELNSYDPVTKKMVSNKLPYNTIDELIADKSNDDDTYLNAITDHVGTNNRNKAIRIPTNHKYIDTAYVEYDNAIYKTVFLKDYPDNNHDLEQGMIKCSGFNDVATNYLETQIINNLQ